MSFHLRSLRSGAVGLALILLMAGCAGAASPSPAPASAPTQSAAPASANTSAEPSTAALPSCAGLGNITLNVLSGENSTGQMASLSGPTKAFEAKNPNVKVNITFKDFDTFLKTIKLTASSDNPPDIFDGNQGFAIDSPLIKAGLVLNLDKYASAFGWDKTFTPGTIAPNRFSTDGTQFGTGSLWGLSQASEYVAVFYNKTLLEKIGITDPTTLDTKQAFEDALAKAKAAGLMPIMEGDSEGWPFDHNYSVMQGWYVPAATSNDWVFGKAGSTFDDQGHQAAAAEIQDWGTKGYFNADLLAITFNDSMARYGKGDAVFYVGGDWATDSISKALGANAGWMLYPAGPDGKHAAVGSVSLPIHISSKTKYPDCAAAYLDFITASDEAKQSMLDNGRIPATGVPATMKSSNPLVQQEVSEYSRLIADDGLMAWEDWATPTMLDLMNAQNQLLVAGKVTPAAYTKAIQENWNKFYNK